MAVTIAGLRESLDTRRAARRTRRVNAAREGRARQADGEIGRERQRGDCGLMDGDRQQRQQPFIKRFVLTEPQVAGRAPDVAGLQLAFDAQAFEQIEAAVDGQLDRVAIKNFGFVAGGFAEFVEHAVVIAVQVEPRETVRRGQVVRFGNQETHFVFF